MTQTGTTGTVANHKDGPLVVVHRRHWFRYIATIVVLALLGFIAYAFAVNPNFQWHVVAQYLFSPLILGGLVNTLWLTATTMVLGVLIGIVLAVMINSEARAVSLFASGYIWLFRGTPVLVQLILFYNLAALFPTYWIGIPFTDIVFATGSVNDIITPYSAAILGLALNEGAYMCEIVRAGLLSVDDGQREASRALGMRPGQILRKIVLPQAMRFIVPPTGNQTIGMLKGTSIVSVIALADLLYSTQLIYSRTFQTIPLLLVACFWYLAATTILTLLQAPLENWFKRSDAGAHARKKWFSLGSAK